MNYPFLLKFSSVINLSDARYAAGAWADFIGFNFDPASEYYSDPAITKEICSWINGPLIVGEFSNQPIEWIRDFISGFNLKVIQIPASYSNPTVFDLDVKVILEIDNVDDLTKTGKADMLIISEPGFFNILKEKTDKPILVELSNFEIDAKRFDGVALKGKSETSPGTRNHQEWTNFLERYADF